MHHRVSSDLEWLIRTNLIHFLGWWNSPLTKLEDLVRTILEAVANVEEQTPLRESSSLEAIDWCTLIVDRLAEGEQ